MNSSKTKKQRKLTQEKIDRLNRLRDLIEGDASYEITEQERLELADERPIRVPRKKTERPTIKGEE